MDRAKGLFASLRNRGKKLRTLVYVGANTGKSFGELYRNFDRAYAFEAIPDLAEALQIKYAAPNVEIIHGAVCTEDKNQTFYLSRHEGHDGHDFHSSSLGQVNDYYRSHGPKNQVYTDEVVEVPGIVLSAFLEERGVDYIDTYISDIEGMDLTVLKTMKTFLDERRIKNIQVEAECDYLDEASHDGIPGNKEHEFVSLLERNYKLTGKAEGHYHPEAADRWINRDLFFSLK